MVFLKQRLDYRYIGEYKLINIPNAFPVILIKKNGTLCQKGSPDKELKAESPDKFFIQILMTKYSLY